MVGSSLDAYMLILATESREISALRSSFTGAGGDWFALLNTIRPLTATKTSKENKFALAQKSNFLQIIGAWGAQ